MDYFYIENNSQKGPVSLENLAKLINLDTSVWRVGMDDWTKASDVPEVAEALGAAGQASAPQPEPAAQPQYPASNPGPASCQAQNAAMPGSAAGQQSMAGKPDNNLIFGIIVTVLCCMPFGVASVIFASKVDRLWLQGQYDESRAAAQKAKKFAIWGIVMSVVFSILYVIFITLVGGVSALSQQ